MSQTLSWMVEEQTHFEIVLLEYIGVYSGIFDALYSSGRTLDDLAATLKLEKKPLQSYCKTATAYGLLEENGGKFQLADRVRGSLPRQSPGSYASSYVFRGAWAYVLSLYPKALRGESVDIDGFIKGLIASGSKKAGLQFALRTLKGQCDFRSPHDILDLGCGEGVFLKELLSMNPHSSGIGVEIQPSIADVAKAEMRDAGLGERVRIHVGDVRNFKTDRRFDIVLINSLLHYLPEKQRGSIVKKSHGWLKTGGCVAILEQPGYEGTALRKRPRLGIMEMVFLIMERTTLPTEKEILSYLEGAGFGGISVLPVDPKGTSKYFIATK